MVEARKRRLSSNFSSVTLCTLPSASSLFPKSFARELRFHTNISPRSIASIVSCVLKTQNKHYVRQGPTKINASATMISLRQEANKTSNPRLHFVLGTSRNGGGTLMNEMYSWYIGSKTFRLAPGERNLAHTAVRTPGGGRVSPDSRFETHDLTVTNQ